jgi:DNA-binding winged helix-turn-helix (wHTH) protein
MRHPRNGVVSSSIRLRCAGCSCISRLVNDGHETPEIIVELSPSELVRLLPQRQAEQMYELLQRQFAKHEEIRFPCLLGDIVRNESLLSALRTNLAHVKNLTDLITDPPDVLIDERQKLFFYRGIPVMLRPISFSLLILLAITPREFVMREVIYNHLWPGEANYQGTNKPYERQISDHKRKLIAEIRKGMTGKAEMAAGEMETLISTRAKVGYMLNLAKENVLILNNKGFLFIIFSFISDWDQYLTDLLWICQGRCC